MYSLYVFIYDVFFVVDNKALLTEEYIGKDSLPRLTTKNTSVTDVFFVYDGYIVDNR